ncbi:MAG TPA: FHA domain-containing protein [Phycisphaerales bacterium]|nr:FHA domain-containing protein [Phycisphaerales bacterium]
MASILIVSGPGEGAYCPLGKRTVIVGRDEGATVQINDVKVSRKHLQIRLVDSGSYVALDMKSANGSRLNGEPISGEVELKDHDVLEVGTSKLAFSTTDFPDRESAINQWKKRGQRDRSTISDA